MEHPDCKSCFGSYSCPSVPISEMETSFYNFCYLCGAFHPELLCACVLLSCHLSQRSTVKTESLFTLESPFAGSHTFGSFLFSCFLSRNKPTLCFELHIKLQMPPLKLRLAVHSGPKRAKTQGLQFLLKTMPCPT